MADVPEEVSIPMPPSDPHGDGPARPMKDAATVVLLRDSDRGIEVFLQRRVNAMAFAAGMTVFPGGGVDGRDADTTVRWAGPSPAEWASSFDCGESLARSLVCAAVRETFEESGVLFAGTEDDVVADTAEHATARQRLIDRNVSLAAFLAENGLTLRADLLRPWANWVTPPPAPRRYDTRFFLAALPSGQRADGATTEADRSGWQRPEDALADAEAGRSMLMPPTWYTLAELREFDTVADALNTERQIVKITPTLERDGERLKVVLEGR